MNINIKCPTQKTIERLLMTQSRMYIPEPDSKKAYFWPFSCPTITTLALTLSHSPVGTWAQTSYNHAKIPTSIHWIFLWSNIYLSTPLSLGPHIKTKVICTRVMKNIRIKGLESCPRRCLAYLPSTSKRFTPSSTCKHTS